MPKFALGAFCMLLAIGALKWMTDPGKLDGGTPVTPVEIVQDKERGTVCYIALTPIPRSHRPVGISCVYDPTADLEVSHEQAE